MSAISTQKFHHTTKRIMAFIIVVILGGVSGGQVFSQTAADYLFSNSTGTFSPITGTISTASGDDGTQSAIAIGFTFRYCGTNYTTFNVSTNGHIYLSGASTWTNDLASTTNKTIIAPLWDDLFDDASSDVQYQLSGSSPNQVMTIQWRQIRWTGSSGSQQNFQIKLYETTNIIEFVYGAMNASVSGTASIGINDATGGSGHFISITPAASPASSSTVANNSINASTFLTAGLIYRFSPPTCFKPTGVTSSAVTATTATISWTAAVPPPGSGYEYEVRTSGAAGSGPAGLSTSGSTASGVVSANLIGLSPSTTYYVYVRSYCGGTDYSAWTSSYSFATACGSITLLPWSENFDAMSSIGNSVIPSCWRIESGSGTPWSSGNAASITNNDPSSTPYYIYCNYTPTATDKYLITPGFSLTAGTSYDFKFKYAGDGYSGWTADVKYNTSQTGTGSTFYANFISSATTTSATYTEVKTTFVPSATTTYYFIIRVNNTASPFYLGFDDFSLSLSPAPVVTVNATSGPAVYAGYQSVKSAFDAINAGTHNGDITVTVGNTDNQTLTETTQAQLIKSGTGAANYSSILVRPGAANMTITGSFGAGLATIYFNTAQNVTIDGRIGSAGTTHDLTIENTSTAASSGALYLYGAQNNTIRYCNLKSSTSSNAGLGTITFMPSTALGCSNNTIENCTITKSGAAMPQTAIGSRSLSSTYKNTGNTVKSCTISDFQRVGIWLGSYTGTTGYNDLWTIEGNTFYESSPINLNLSNNNGTTTYDNFAILIGHVSAGSIIPAYNEYGSFIIKNNTIGGNGSGGSWTATGTSSSNKVMGIYLASNGTSTTHSEIYGNTIGSYDIETQYFYGIFTYTYTRVKVGSSGGNAVSNVILKHPAASGGSFGGIYINTNSDYANEIKNNSVSNLSAASGNRYANFYGIYNYSSTTHPKDIIRSNVVTGIDASNADGASGLYVQGYVTQNHVSKIKYFGTNPLYGIYWNGGRATGLDYRVENNEVILGMDNSGSATAINSDVYGIYATRSELNLFYNSVLLQGTATTKNSYCLRLNSNATGYVVKNNLLYNERSGGTGNHYCISTAFTTTTYWTSSNNAYIQYSGTKTTYNLGDWAGTAKNTLSDWATSSAESSSISESSTNKPVATFFPNLSGANNLNVTDSWLCKGVVVAPAFDFINASRAGSSPTTIGAYELACSTLPVELVSFTARCVNEGINLEWTTYSETNNDYFTVERSADGERFEPVLMKSGAGNSNELQYYEVCDLNPDAEINYYRLKQTDYDGTSTFSEVISVDCSAEDFDISLFPNPVWEHIDIYFNGSESGNIRVMMTNHIGQNIEIKCTAVDENKMTILFSQEIAPGYYFIHVSNDTQSKIFKIIKM